MLRRNKYLTNLRIQKAKTLLLVPSLKISEISHMAGFQDTSYFVRTFKELTGSTPQEFRLMAAAQGKGETDHETEMPRIIKPVAED